MTTKKLSSILCLAFLAAMPVLAIEPNSTCDALAKWAAGLEKLPADFASFTALEPGQRSAVYKRLSGAQRAALWHEQLSRELAHDGWNEVQRALIAESRAFATAENLTAKEAGVGTASATAQAALDSLVARVKQEFTRQDALRVFYALGREASAQVGSGFYERCNCKEGWTELCGPIGVEHCAVATCDWSWCGYMWSETCDLRCIPCMGDC